MCDDLDQRVRALLGSVLRVPPDTLSDDTRRGTMEAWDSLAHVVLVSTLSEEFNVEVSPERALEMYTLGDVKRIMGELIE